MACLPNYHDSSAKFSLEYALGLFSSVSLSIELVDYYWKFLMQGFWRYFF